jgi:hypothetical protein
MTRMLTEMAEAWTRPVNKALRAKPIKGCHVSRKKLTTQGVSFKDAVAMPIRFRPKNKMPK